MIGGDGGTSLREILASGLSGLPYRRRGFAPLAVAAALVIYLLSGAYAVQTDEMGVVFRFGRVVADGVPPGIHYHLPFPVERAVRLKTAEIKKLIVGVPDTEASQSRSGGGFKTLTGDTNVLQVQVIIQYGISDPVKYLVATEDPTRFIRAATEQALTTVVSSTGVDGLLTTEKLAIQNLVKDRVQALVESYDVGVKLIGAYFQEIGPTTEVARAFREVASAREDKTRMINDAEGYRNVAIPITRGEAQRIVSDAASYRLERVERARGETDRFTALLVEYKKSSDVTAGRLYLEKMEKILSGLRVFIMDKEGDKAVSTLRLFLPESEPKVPQPFPFPED
ncbi:MAG: FtsH protease activity modulator HflK [bacterium]